MTATNHDIPAPCNKAAAPARPVFRLSAVLLTLALCLLNIAVYYYQLHFADPLADRESNLLLFGANVYQLSLTGDWWRYPVSMVLHADLTHLVINTLALLVIGINCEALYGKIRMAVIYGVSGIGAAFFSAYQQFLDHHSYVLLHDTVYIAVGVGASGAVMGIAAAVAVALLHELYRTPLPPARRTLYRRNLMSVCAMILLTLVSGMETGTDNVAHIAGAAIGGSTGLAYVLCQRHRKLTVVVSLVLIALLALALYRYSFSYDEGLLDERQFILSEVLKAMMWQR